MSLDDQPGQAGVVVRYIAPKARAVPARPAPTGLRLERGRRDFYWAKTDEGVQYVEGYDPEGVEWR
jgi:hypothetical protein